MTDDSPAAYRVWPWFVSLVGLILLDQSTKFLVRANLNLHESIPLIGEDLLRLTHVQNPGIIFGHTFITLPLLIVFGWTASVLLAVYLYRLARRHDLSRWPVMLFLAGAVGNSIDRTLFGKVTDFVDADFRRFHHGSLGSFQCRGLLRYYWHLPNDPVHTNGARSDERLAQPRQWTIPRHLRLLTDSGAHRDNIRFGLIVFSKKRCLLSLAIKSTN